MSVLFCFVLVYVFICSAHGATIGVCWGQVAYQPFPPTAVVRLLQANNITKVKLFNTDSGALNALAITNIEVMVMVANELIRPMAVSQEFAANWVYLNIQPYLAAGTNIKYVSVSNEPFLTNVFTYNNTLVPAVENMQLALESAGINDRVKVTVSFNSEILGTSYPPSAGQFEGNWTEQITAISDIINRTGSIFSVNIYPFYVLKVEKVPYPGYIFFDKESASTNVIDGAYTYSNVFEANYDALYAALARIGYPDLPIIVGEIGWPSDGHPLATLSYAQEFNSGVIKSMLGGKGTPRHPNVVIDGYLFSLFDEDAKSIKPGNFERYWGIYDRSGTPKFPLDLTGGTEAGASGQLATMTVDFLKKEWCVAFPNATGLDDIISFLCMNGDLSNYGSKVNCLPIDGDLTTPGSICGLSSNSIIANASYVMNEYFQIHNQNSSMCNFDGNGQLVKVDPSYGECKFGIGMDLKKMSNLASSSEGFSVYVFAYLFGLIIILTNFL